MSRLTIRDHAIGALFLGFIPVLAWAQGASQQSPDPQMIQAGLKQELGKALFEAGQYQAAAAQAQAALTKAQGEAAALKSYWAAYTASVAPVAETGPHGPKKP